jgi:hypothetical protein
MTLVEQLFDTLGRLTPDERAEFRQRFYELDAQQWEEKVAADSSAGRLAWLAEEAKRDFEAGRCTER